MLLTSVETLGFAKQMTAPGRLEGAHPQMSAGIIFTCQLLHGVHRQG